MSFIHLIRFPNLLIVLITQYLLQYLILLPAFQTADVSPLLDHFHFFLLTISTVCIAAGGYIINDIIDYEIDKINKPEKVFIGKNISLSRAKGLYWIISIIGLMLSLYLAIHINNLPLFLIYPVAVVLLWMYSAYFKRQVLSGNILVSVFCAFVAGLVLFAERESFSQLSSVAPQIGKQVGLVFGIYLIFAFLSTMFREIVKDMEDIEGDKTYNCRTMPIAWGFAWSKGIAFIFGLLLLIGLVHLCWIFVGDGRLVNLLFCIIFIMLPTITALVLLVKAKNGDDYKKMSNLAKFIMLMGLLLIFLI
ncbi:MAG: UbiA family prenyltransferase [Bacteroidetes bacterium]|nr:UbiA family prenyltransferase [Bacteroidota bacterium]